MPPLRSRSARSGDHPALPGARRCRSALAALVLAALLATLLGGAAPASAQDVGPKPVMQNVFFNVVWGSATGAALGFASAILAASDKSNPQNVRGQAFQGATLGGLIGLGVGVYLVYSGITFDPTGSTLTGQNDPSGRPELFAALAEQPVTPLFTFETSPQHPDRITGFKALVVNFRF
jgi:hypothetical protein